MPSESKLLYVVPVARGMPFLSLTGVTALARGRVGERHSSLISLPGSWPIKSGKLVKALQVASKSECTTEGDSSLNSYGARLG